ncbi:MAG: DUF2961 domain-containing protein [Planctomycetes bacterium]|nr:DUF2961 domain-containing protein [Planctomycetota bacterium]
MSPDCQRSHRRRPGCRILPWLCLVAFLPTVVVGAAEEPPILPVGLDAYRAWDHWADQRIGQRAYLRSTYDRGGGNLHVDASNFLYQLADDANVTLDLEGRGIVMFMRYNHWHGSPWHYLIDGTDHVLSESMTAQPDAQPHPSTFIPAGPFPEPLAYTWSTTRGADLIWTPLPFTKSFRMAYERTRYGTGYYIYDLFTPGALLSQPLTAMDWSAAPAQDVIALIGRAGQDLLPAADSPEAQHMGLTQQDGAVIVPKDDVVTIATLAGPAQVRGLDFSVPIDQAIAFGRTRLRVTWDDRAKPSIDAPVALFFGTGTLYNRTQAADLVKAFPVHVHFSAQRAELACYFPMPFFASARIELVGNGEAPVPGVSWKVRSAPFSGAPNQVGYFHATFRDHGAPTPGKDLVLLDSRGEEGSAVWSGSLVGTTFTFSDRADLGTLEGDPRFFFDDSRSPQVQGTGSEEWGGGGDYWGGATMTLPFAGHPVGAHSRKDAQGPEDMIESGYRFLLGDLMPFGSNALIQMEHGGTDESTEHYRTVAYWYGLPAASLVKTDTLEIGDAANETSHRYASPAASAPYQITSLYEVGVDTVKGKRVQVPETMTARKTAGTSEFVLAIDPANVGVLLRRTLDYALPDQRAEVWIADGGPNAASGDSAAWQSAGTWYLAGSNSWVSSDPKGELGASEHDVRTSNRRFRDDEFLLPRDLTRGRAAIRVRVVCAPVHHPLVPGRAEGELAWSEIRYAAYSYLMPAFVAPAAGGSGARKP